MGAQVHRATQSTRPQDVDGFLAVVRELGARLMATAAARTHLPD